jgi:hypothetical protein
MTRGKASTSAWGRPGSPQRPIGTTRSRTCAARPVLRGRPRSVLHNVAAAIDDIGAARPREER